MELPDATTTTAAAICAHNACKGIAKIGGLILGDQFRNKEYRDALMKAQADRDIEDIKAGNARFDGKVLHPALALPEMPLNVSLEYLPILEGQRQESNNLNANLGIALGILADTDDKDISDEPVSPDWFARWRREAQGIGDQSLQNIWGRILAEEVKRPQSVSLKTLDVLKNVTATDAELFCRVAQYHIQSVIPDKVSAYQWPYTLRETIYLEGLGFLGGKNDLRPEVSDVLDSDKKGFICQGFILVFDLPPKITSLGRMMTGPVLSIAGNEILQVADNIPSAHPETIKIVGDFVWKNLPNTCQIMEAYPLTSNSEFDENTVLRSWHR